MTDIERFWHDLMEGRRYTINEVYGNEAMLRYRPHPKEKEYFLKNNGRFTYDIEVADYTQRFWKMCEEMYGHKRKEYEQRLLDQAKKSKAYAEYKKGAAEREALADKIKAVLLAHAKETDQNGQQSQ